MDELFAIFRSALASRPALKFDAIEVGGAYKGGGSDLRLYNASMTHDSDGEPDIDYIDPMWHAEGGKQSLLLCVQIEFAPIDMFRASPLHLLEYDGQFVFSDIPLDSANLKNVPNVLRSTREYLILGHDYIKEDDDHRSEYENYMRMLRVFPHHTMKDIQNALADVEGWNRLPDCRMEQRAGYVVEGDQNVFEEFHNVNAEGENMVPSVWFYQGPAGS